MGRRGARISKGRPPHRQYSARGVGDYASSTAWILGRHTQLQFVEGLGREKLVGDQGAPQ
jgi:hypothetical protein